VFLFKEEHYLNFQGITSTY